MESASTRRLPSQRRARVPREMTVLVPPGPVAVVRQLMICPRSRLVILYVVLRAPLIDLDARSQLIVRLVAAVNVAALQRSVRPSRALPVIFGSERATGGVEAPGMLSGRLSDSTLPNTLLARARQDSAAPWSADVVV